MCFHSCEDKHNYREMQWCPYPLCEKPYPPPSELKTARLKSLLPIALALAIWPAVDCLWLLATAVRKLKQAILTAQDIVKAQVCFFGKGYGNHRCNKFQLNLGNRSKKGKECLYSTVTGSTALPSYRSLNNL